jgi:hypothetical protein
LDAFSRMFSWPSLAMLAEARGDELNRVVLVSVEILVSLCYDVVGLGGFCLGALLVRVLRGVKALFDLGF